MAVQLSKNLTEFCNIYTGIMALFSRRTLERLLNENSAFLTVEQLNNHVSRLNKGDLSCEWEVAVLNAFSRIGKVIHEPSNFGTSARLDLHFVSAAGTVEFLADITTVSDAFAESENPTDYLEARLLQIKLKHSLPGGFGFTIRGNTARDVFLKKRQETYLPRMKELEREVFQTPEFKTFIKRVVANRNKADAIRILGDNTDIDISYTLSSISSSSFPTYKEIIDLESNPIWNALIAKYKRQLKKSGYNGLQGIILCDGDCYGLKNSMPSWYAKSAREVIQHFLRKKMKVGFVLSLFPKLARSHSGKNTVDCRFYKGVSFSDADFAVFDCFTKNIASLFPSPSHDSANARNRLVKGYARKGDSFSGGMMIRGNEIRVSARTVLDLLSGQLHAESYPSDYQIHFARKLSEGSLIIDACVERSPEDDDDWLVFRFGEPDVAVSPFSKR